MAKKPVLTRGQYMNAELDKLLPRDDDGKLLKHAAFARAPKTSLVLGTMTLIATLESENNALREVLKKKAEGA